MKEKGTAIIYSSHRLEEAMEIADRVTVFRDGAKIETLEIKDTSEDRLIELMVGRQIEQRYVKEQVPIGEVVLEAEGLAVEGLIRNCSLSVRRGEIVGIAGLMARSHGTATLAGIYRSAGMRRWAVGSGDRNRDAPPTASPIWRKTEAKA